MVRRRGALTATDKKGRTVFHLAAEMPRTKPAMAVFMMRTLMERLCAAPPGMSQWTAGKSGGGGGGEGESVEGGGEGGGDDNGNDLEPWPAEEETLFTAWHVLVRHKMTEEVRVPQGWGSRLEGSSAVTMNCVRTHFPLLRFAPLVVHLSISHCSGGEAASVQAPAVRRQARGGGSGGRRVDSG